MNELVISYSLKNAKAFSNTNKQQEEFQKRKRRWSRVVDIYLSIYLMNHHHVSQQPDPVKYGTLKNRKDVEFERRRLDAVAATN